MKYNEEWVAKSKVAADDVFSAAEWFSMLWNSSAKAVAFDKVEWQCNTWGSGRGAGSWEDWGLFALVAKRFDLATFGNDDARDELVIAVPLDRMADIVKLVDDIGENCEEWPWLVEDDGDEELDDEAYEMKRIVAASAALGVPVEVLAADGEWLELLRLI